MTTSSIRDSRFVDKMEHHTIPPLKPHHFIIHGLLSL